MTAPALQALISGWRKDAATWRHGVGDNVKARTIEACADDLETALAGIREASASSPWLPIDTAPKDGTEVLVAGPARSHIEGPQRLYVSSVRFCEGEGWYEVNNDPTDVWGEPLSPTHWMPLPSPPGERTDKERS